MKLKRILIAVMAVSSLLLYGCEDESTSKKENTKADTITSVSTESASHDPEKKLTLPSAPTMNSNKIKPAKVNNDGSKISGTMIAGIHMTAPEGINLYDNEQSIIITPEFIPTSAEPLIVTDSKGNNMNFFASAGTDYETFNKLRREDMEETFLAGVASVFDSVEITSYTTGVYSGYNGIRIDTNGILNGSPVSQTILMINAVKENTANGYCYTITYTDITGDMQDAIEKSVSTIDISGVNRLYAKYSTPEECAEAQKTGQFQMFDGESLRKNKFPDRNN